jgi:hypothetical protein
LHGSNGSKAFPLASHRDSVVASIAVAQAPTTGWLTGTVKDPSDAIIRGAAIVAKNAQTAAEFGETTNEVGVLLMLSFAKTSADRHLRGA